MNDRTPICDRTLILRILVPGLEARLHDKMKEMQADMAVSTTKAMATNSNKPNNANTKSVNKNLLLNLEGVMCVPTTARNSSLWNFHCDGATYPAKLVNLPCPVEIHKTHDHATYYKSADVAQMLIVYGDDMALEEAEEKAIKGEASYYPSGLTPPMKRVVERRFAAREHKVLAPPRTAVAHVEQQLLELMEKLAKDDKGKRRNKVPKLTSANQVLEEVEEEIVDYEPWMSDHGQQPHGIEFDSNDPLCLSHPEVWLDANTIRELRDAHMEAKKPQVRAGDRVVIWGLEEMPSLNGEVVEVFAPASSQAASGQWVIQRPGFENTTMSISEENLFPLCPLK